MEKQKNIPKLRFPEFQGEWDKKRGNEVFDSISDKNHNSDLPLLAISQEYGAVPRAMIDYRISVTDKSIESYKIVRKGNFIISLRSFQGGIEYSEYEGICSPAYIVLKSKVDIDDYFFKYYLKTDTYISELNKKLEGIRDGKMISYNYFSDITLPFPSLQEQTKIAAFISAVDEKLQSLKKKKNLLEEYKKGVMKKIFSQELRFKDENGKSFEEWKINKLGEIGETYNGLSGKSKENFGIGKPYIQYKQIFDNSKIDISKFEYVQIDKNENQNKVIYGDILFTISSETPDEIGMSSVLLNNIENLYLNSFCFGYRPYSLEVLSPNYARFLFRSDLFRKEVIILAQGSTRYNLSKIEMMKLKISLPSLPEQTKIADFLSAVDDKIMEGSKQIDKIEGWKKGLLQKLFC